MPQLTPQERTMRQKAPIDLSASAKPEFEELEIITDPMAMSTLDELAFNEDLITVIIARGPAPHSPKSVPVGVNGEQLSIPVGVPVIVKRKFIEHLFRCKSDNIETVVEDVAIDGTTDKRNMMHTWTTPRFSPSVIEDKSGVRGQQWLSNMMAI
jgi:hypothetical protein